MAPVKSVSPSLIAQVWSLIPHVHFPFNLFPHAQAESSEGIAFSMAALSQVQCKAAFFPQEQVDFLAQMHSVAEQVMVNKIFVKDETEKQTQEVAGNSMSL